MQRVKGCKIIAALFFSPLLAYFHTGGLTFVVILFLRVIKYSKLSAYLNADSEIFVSLPADFKILSLKTSEIIIYFILYSNLKIISMIAQFNYWNIRRCPKVKWLGMTGSNKGFCVFSSAEYGIRAAAIIMWSTYWRHGFRTIRHIISRWAPPVENDTERYIRFVCSHSGFAEDYVPQNAHERALVMHYMAIMETGSTFAPSVDDILHVLKKHGV